MDRSEEPRTGWGALAILALGQFVMVLDSSVMNVSISDIVADLDTTVAGVQLAITAYTLVMASFMLAGAKLGDRWGQLRTFRIGLAVYGTGSLLTALSPNLAMLLFGWSLVEGLGAVLVIPAIAALTVSTYRGTQRAFAYGVLGGVSGAAIAAGPLIGGWVTSSYTWRYVFAGEVAAVILMLVLGRNVVKGAARPTTRDAFDVAGAATSAVGFGLAVYGVLKSGAWGWIRPQSPPVISGTEITPFGWSPVPFVIAAGVAVLAWCVRIEAARIERGEPALIDLRILRPAAMRAGLSTLVLQQLTLLGMFFALPVYLQTVLGLDAFESGVRILPLSVALLVASMLGPRLAARSSPRRVVRIGLAALSAGSLATAASVDVELRGVALATSLALFGVGAGLLLSQLGNVIMSAAPVDRSSEAGGLQGTAQNLGASLGTAFIGSVLLLGLGAGVTEQVDAREDLPQDVRERILDAAEAGMEIVPVDAVESAAVDAGISSADARELAEGYADAELFALRRALFFVALVTAGIWTSRSLPTPPLGSEETADHANGAPVP